MTTAILVIPIGNQIAVAAAFTAVVIFSIEY
jgi:hypothetical protein